MNMSKIAVFIPKVAVVGVLFLTLHATTAIAQVTETFDIISTSGKIIDKRSGQELQIGDKVNLQTELEFNSLHDRAVLLNSNRAKYYLELPRASLVSEQLIVSSSLALTPVRSRPALITGTRGALTIDGLSPQNLRRYFEVDTFTIIGDKFTIPVLNRDRDRFDLLLKYESETSIEEFLSPDFVIYRDKLKFQGRGISECFILLVEGDRSAPVTQLSLFFVEKEQLFAEFDALLNAFSQCKSDNTTRDVLRQYSFDVHGKIDRNSLDAAINEFLGL